MNGAVPDSMRNKKMSVEKAYETYQAALKAGLSHKDAMNKAVGQWSYAGVTVRNLAMHIINADPAVGY